ncbi:MAG: OsmC family protein [Pseudomonadota bacterium]
MADEPSNVPGGTNLGPSPYDLLGASLASCTSMTLQMYAKHKKLPLQVARVQVQHSRVHAEDCAECEKSSGLVDRFDRRVELIGPLDDETRSRMLEIADRCPVHKTLHNEIQVVTSALESGDEASN